MRIGSASARRRITRKRLELVLERQSVTGLHFDRRRAVRREAPKPRTPSVELVLASAREDRAPRSEFPHRAARSPCSPRPAARYSCSSSARPAENRVRVRIDEPGVSTPPRQSISRAPWCAARTSSSRSHRGEPVPDDSHGDARPARRRRSSRAAARRRRPAHVTTCARRRTFGRSRDSAHAIMSRMRDSLSGACASPRHA